MSVLVDVTNIKSVTDKYQKAGEFTKPAQEKINPELKKTSEYCLSQCKAAFSLLVRDKMAIPIEHYSYIQLIRDYMTASQPTELYDTITRGYVPDTTNTGSSSSTQPSNRDVKRKGLEGINTKIVSIATNLMNAIHGMWDDYEEDIYVDSIDNESGAEQERAMFEALFDAKMSPVTKFMEQNYGIPISDQNNLPTDITLEEMEVYRETGGFKTYWAESTEEAIRYTEKISNWDKIIKRKYIEDAVAINFLAGRSKYDPSIRKEVWEYMDPANTFIQYSQEKSFDDAEYGGYFALEKIGTLVELGFDSDELMKAAEKYKDYLGNPKVDDWSQYHKAQNLDAKIRDFKVPVFHYYWIECDDTLNKKTTNQYGVTTVNKRSIDQEINELSEEKIKKGYQQEVFKTRLKRTYQCSWIVDTDMVYDYGLLPNQTKKGTRAELPIKAWRGIATNDRMVFGSIMESIIPFLDHLQLAWEKYQDALAKFHPGGYKINLRLLKNLQVGGQKIDELEAYKMFWETGVMPYLDVAIGENYSGGDVSPISRIEGMTAEGIAMFKDEIAFISSMIEKITGINPVTMGTTEQGVTATATSMAATGTNNVMKPLINGIFDIKEGLAGFTSRKLPLLFRNMKDVREEYSRVIGTRSVDVIKDAERLGAAYGLTMDARQSEQDIRDLIEMLNVAIQSARDGVSSINIAQAMYIKERAKSGGNFKKLQRQVDLMMRKAEEKDFEKKRQLIAEQNQQQAQIAQAAKQGEAQAEQMKAQTEIQVENAKSENKKKEMQLEYNLKYRQDLFNQKAELMKQKASQPTLV